jgi:DNA-binding FadR family transcriptional regulator
MGEIDQTKSGSPPTIAIDESSNGSLGASIGQCGPPTGENGTSAQARRDLIAIRTLIEREALLLAVARLEQEDILRARHVQEQIEIEKDPKRLEDLDCAFHLALYQPCNNVRLLKLIEDLRREDLRPYHEQPIGSPARAQWSKQHRKLLRACAAGGVADAAAALEVHLATLERT